jgi:hypothetical protein
MTGPHVNILLEELAEFFADQTKEIYSLSRLDVGLLLHYVNYLKQLEQHVKNSLQSDLSPYGFRQNG